jgi:hypothetical protein
MRNFQSTRVCRDSFASNMMNLISDLSRIPDTSAVSTLENSRTRWSLVLSTIGMQSGDPQRTPGLQLHLQMHIWTKLAMPSAELPQHGFGWQFLHLLLQSTRQRSRRHSFSSNLRSGSGSQRSVLANAKPQTGSECQHLAFPFPSVVSPRCRTWNSCSRRSWITWLDLQILHQTVVYSSRQAVIR